jgi:hypothetical protein
MSAAGASGRATAVAVIAAAIAGFALALAFLRQGLDLQGDGLWLLGARFVLDGEDLHANLRTGDAALRYEVLAGWMRVFGESAFALATLRATGHALAVAAAVGLAARTLGPTAAGAVFVAMVAAFALPPAAVAGWIVAGLVALAHRRSPTVAGAVAGAGLGVLFLLDPRWSAVALAASLAAWLAVGVERDRRPAGFGAGLVVVLGLAAIGAAVATDPAIAFRQTFVVPLASMGETVDPGRFAANAWNAAWLDLPFAGLRATGEAPGPAWPAHEITRSLALRAVVLGAVAVVALGAVRLVRSPSSTRVRVGTGLALAAILVLLLRGDVPSFRASAPLVVFAAVALAGTARARIVAAVAMVLLLPLALEPTWMAANRDRDRLRTFHENPRAGTDVDAARIHRLASMQQVLDPAPRESLLVWPALPGVHWLLGTDPATPFVDVPAGPAEDAVAVRELRDRPPRYVLLGFSRALLGHEMITSIPDTWNHLREKYRLVGRVLAGDEDLRVLGPAHSVRPANDRMANQLPMVELTVANDRSPALREEFTVGQGFRTHGRDVEGFAFRVRTEADRVALRLRVNVWERIGDEYDTLLESEDVDTLIEQDGQVVFVEFPVPDSADRDLAILIEPLETPRAEVRLDWRDDDDPREPGDLYPEGDAILGITPVDADLYFLVY